MIRAACVGRRYTCLLADYYTLPAHARQEVVIMETDKREGKN